MNNLLAINYENDRPTVSARELHEFLEVDTPYHIWFPRMCEYGFSDGSDFCTKMYESTGGRPATDAQLTIDMAKEICMLQRNDRGRQARQYFIQLEKDWNSPEKVMARALRIAEQKIKTLSDENEEMKPKALFADAVETSKSSILIGEMAKLLSQNGIEIGQNRLFAWMRAHGYIMTNKNIPTQYSMELGLMEIKERTVNNPDGSVLMTQTTKVTGKGQKYFVNKFLA